MRKMKFRCWRKDLKAMHTVRAIDYVAKTVATWARTGSYGIVGFNQVEFMQVTGLGGEEGQDIYDGDIIEIDNDYGDSFMHLIEYNEEWGGYYVDMSNGDGEECLGLHDEQSRGLMHFKVIGNKYENPELLEQCE